MEVTVGENVGEIYMNSTWLAQLWEYWSAKQEVVGSNPSQTNNQGLLKTGEIMLSEIWDFSIHMIAS